MASSEIILPVFGVRRATPLTRIVRLDLRHQRFSFRAGQAAMVGPADREERVPYSLACAPEEARRDGLLEFLIKIEPSGRWGHLFDDLHRGQRIAVRGPVGSFVLPPKLGSNDLLFIAGGTGIAPIRAMIRHALIARHMGAIRLLYSARTPSDFAYLPELRRLTRSKALQLKLHVTREASERWLGERGRIAPLHLAPLINTRRTLCFVCGPAAMVADVPLMLSAAGLPPRNIKLEKWSS